MMVLLSLILVSGSDLRSIGLGPPQRLEVSGIPIDTEHGHANPAWADIDGDNQPELIVGQFEGGKGMVYGAKFTGNVLSLRKGDWLKASNEVVQVSFG